MKEKNHAGAQVGVQAICAMLFLAIGLIQACAPPSQPELDVEERLIHQRAFESVVWSIPLMNYKAMRDALKESAGVDFNDVAYSKVQTWDPVLFPVIDLRHDQGITALSRPHMTLNGSVPLIRREREFALIRPAR